MDPQHTLEPVILESGEKAAEPKSAVNDSLNPVFSKNVNESKQNESNYSSIKDV